MKRICVFCGSSRGKRREYADAADELAELLVKRELELVYGGARVGLMGMIADSVIKRGGVVTGVISHVLEGKELMHLGLTKLYVVESMHARKAKMAQLADAFIALPGGLGTWEETLEILAWGQVGIHEKPCGVLNVNGYFEPLVKLFEQACEEGFVLKQHRGLLLVDDSPGSLLEQLAAYEPPPLGSWMAMHEL